MQAILAAVEQAAVAAFASPDIWPEAIRMSATFTPRLTVQVRRMEHRPEIGSDRLVQRGITLHGVILVQRDDLGILGEQRNLMTAATLYGALMLDTLSFPTLQGIAGQNGPDADIAIDGAVELVNTAGEGKVALALMVPWRVRTVLTTARYTYTG